MNPPRGDNASLTLAARQLLKSHLRRHVFEARALIEVAEERERVWQSMLALEDSILEAAQAAWDAEVTSFRPDDDALVQVTVEALYAAAAYVLDSFEERIDPDALQRLVKEFVASFKPSLLWDRRARPC